MPAHPLAMTAILLAMTGCGARSSLTQPAERDAGPPPSSCADSPRCSDNTRGVWRLETEAKEAVGHLLTFDGSKSCNYGTNAFLLQLTDPDLPCNADPDQPRSRYGGYTLVVNDADSFQISSDNVGGTSCEADPGDETVGLELTRAPCDAKTYQLVVHDSAPGSIYEISAVATRCRCAVEWDPCKDPAPDELCNL